MMCCRNFEEIHCESQDAEEAASDAEKGQGLLSCAKVDLG